MSLLQLLLYMLGQFGIMLLTRYLFQWTLRFSDTPTETGPLFLASIVGAVFLGYRIFDGITDPMAGGLADWWVSRGRKRTSLLMLSFWIAPVGLVMCFVPDESMSPLVRWVLLVTGMFVFFVGYTIYAIPYWSLVEDYGRAWPEGRRLLSNMLGLGLILATIVGFVVTPLLIHQFGYRDGAAVVAILAMGCMVAPVYAGRLAQADEQLPHRESVSLGAIIRSFGKVFKNRRFVALMTLLAGSQMSFTVLTAAAPYIAIQLLNGTDKDVSLLLGPLIVTALPMFAFAPAVSRRFGWEHALIGTSVLLGGVYCLTASITGMSLVGSAKVTAMLVFSCAGPMIAVLLALDAEAITACVGSDEKGAVSMYFGVYNLVIKTLNGVALFLTGLLVDLANGSWGATAVRLMLVLAALLLFTGVTLSGLIRRGFSSPPEPARQ
ncbi:MAG: MFS transporter [Gemmataceae bacterium]|nr:MFS transporter [Gemmata sp.]MDW8196743.1 MFS transporter [Gemmataceae bacterium]